MKDNSKRGVLGLPLERQKELAARRGMTHEEWVKHTLAYFDEVDKAIELAKASIMTKEERDEKIFLLRNNPNQIYFYRRVTGNDNLTVEQAIKAIEMQYEIDQGKRQGRQFK